MSETKNEDEIEVTPEMIEAGVTELVGYNDDFESAEDAIRRIWQAMWQERPRPSR